MAVFVFGQMFPDVGVREVVPQLDPVALPPKVHEADLIEGLVQRLQHRPILAALQATVVEGQPPVLYRHHHLPRATQYVDVQGTFLLGAEGVLDDVQAHQLHGSFYVLGIDQAKPKRHLFYELHDRRQQRGVGRDRDAGDLFFRRNLHLGQANRSSTTTGQDNPILAFLDDIRQTGDKPDEPNARSMLDRSLPKLWRYHPRVQVIQEEAFYEGFPASHPYLIEGVGEVILHRVLGDKERRGHLLSRGASQDEIHYFSLARAEPVSGRLEPGYSSRSRRFDEDHVLAGIPGPGLCKGALQRQPPA
jgi:hypothetical protein